MTTKFDCQVVNGLSKVVCGRVDLLEKMLGVKVRENLRYSDIQKIVKSGFAKEFFDIGDEIMTKYTDIDGTVYDFPFDIVSFEPVVKEGETKASPAMWLESHYVIEGPSPDTNDAIYYAKDGLSAGTYCLGLSGAKYYIFELNEDVPAGGQVFIAGKDSLSLWVGTWTESMWFVHTFVSNSATEPIEKNIPLRTSTTPEGTVLGNIYGNTINEEAGINSLCACLFGYNKYSSSNVRQWLNSDADSNEWITPQSKFYRPPVSLEYGFSGFMRGLESEFVDIVSPVEVKTKLNDYESAKQNNTFEITYDKFFLPSMEQEYCDTPYPGIEGSYWPYWKERLKLNSPQEEIISVEEHIKYLLTSKHTSKIGKFRTPVNKNTYQVYGINTNGFINAHYGYPYYAPCCVIS